MTACIEAVVRVLRAVAAVAPQSPVRVDAVPGQVARVRVDDVDVAAGVARALGAGSRLRLDRGPLEHPVPAMRVTVQVAGEWAHREIPLPATTPDSDLPVDLGDRVAELLSRPRWEVDIIRAVPVGSVDVHVYPVVLQPRTTEPPVTVEISAVEPDPAVRRRSVPMRT